MPGAEKTLLGAGVSIKAAGPSPPTLAILRHGRSNRRGRAGQGHSSIRIDDWDDLAGARLLEIKVTHAVGDTGMNVGIRRGRRKRDGWCHLLHRLNLVLERGGVGRAAGERRLIGRGGVN